ncbi:MAG: oligosaccharide flippase family protein [Pyrinomonadaceae bacterium]
MTERPEITRFLIVKNGAYSVFSWLFPIFVALISTRLIVGGLGTDAYGLYAMIIGFVSYSFSFGIGKTAAKYVAELRSAGEIDRMSQAVSAVLIVSTLFGAVVLLVTYFTASIIVSDLLGIAGSTRPAAATALVLAALTILFTMVSQVFQFILQGLHRFDRYLILTNISGLLLSIGNVVLALNDFGVVALVAWNCLLVAAIAPVFFAVSRRLLPEFRFRLSIPRDVWRNVLVYAGSIAAYQTFGNALLLFERAWIVRKFGTEALTFYVLPMLLCLYFHGLVSSLVMVIFPVVNELLNEEEKLARLYRTSIKAVFALTALFAVSTVITGGLFLNLWLGEAFAERSYLILIIHVATFSIISMTIIAWQMTESFGVARANAFASGTWFLISVPLMVVFSQTWQTEGVAVARLIGVTGFVGLIIYVDRKFVRPSDRPFWAPTLLRILVAATAAATVEFALTRVITLGWLAFGISGIVGAATFIATLYFVGFIEDEEKATISDIVSRMRSPASR